LANKMEEESIKYSGFVPLRDYINGL